MGSFWYGKVGVQKLSGFLCDGSAVHNVDVQKLSGFLFDGSAVHSLHTFVEKTVFLLHAEMHGWPRTQKMTI